MTVPFRGYKNDSAILIVCICLATLLRCRIDLAATEIESCCPAPPPTLKMNDEGDKLKKAN
jgi:hypothetical protein